MSCSTIDLSGNAWKGVSPSAGAIHRYRRTGFKLPSLPEVSRDCGQRQSGFDLGKCVLISCFSVCHFISLIYLPISQPKQSEAFDRLTSLVSTRPPSEVINSSGPWLGCSGPMHAANTVRQPRQLALSTYNRDNLQMSEARNARIPGIPGNRSALANKSEF